MRAMKTFAIAVLAAACSMAGCGGTSSETPWPVEPVGPTVGPSGETAPPGTPDDLEGEAIAPEETGEPNPSGGQ